MSAQSDLLFGVFAVQLGLSTSHQVMDAAAAWAADRSLGLADRLVADGVLKTDSRELIDKMVAEAICAHGGDTSKTVDTFSKPAEILPSFGGDIQESEDESQQPRTSDSTDLDDELSITANQSGRYSLCKVESKKTDSDDEAACEIGRGGIGRILLAVDNHLGREVALKELLADNSAQAKNDPSNPRISGALVRFLREARVTGQLEHPNIVPVYELGRHQDGTLYYTMKVVRGQTLADALADCQGFEDRIKLLSHFKNICHAIAYAHSRNVVHRDIKPENVMLGAFGETVVLDWGLAKVRGKRDIRGAEIEQEIREIKDAQAGETIAGRAFGTAAYMSPEQAEGKVEEIDERSDVWSLGAVLFEILTGRQPFEGVNHFEVLGKVLRRDAPLAHRICSDVPRELSIIAKKALSRNRQERYQSAGNLAEDIDAYQSGKRVEVYEYGSWELLKKSH